MGLFSKLKKGFKEAGKNLGEGQFAVGGKKVGCPICDGQVFDRSSAQLNTSVATFLNFDWANKTADNLVCLNCGYVLWFVKKPERIVE